VLQPARTIGLDISTRFLALARTTYPALDFVEHDVTRSPFSTGMADLLFAHLLLTHLPDPLAAITTWAGQLQPEGLILCDEVEAIETSQPIFATYLDIVATLAQLPDQSSFTRRASDLARVPVRTADAAGMFRLNFAVWRDDPFIRATYPAQLLADLRSELEVLTASEAQGEITWSFRQIVFVARGN
jgi:SAM-dependent methyltransferase